MLGETITWGLKTFAVTLAVLAALVVAAAVASATTGFRMFEPRTILVEGSASISVPADTVEMFGDLLTSAKSATDALDRNKAIMARIVEGLQADGISRDSIRTTQFSVASQHPRVAGSAYAVDELVTQGYVAKSTIKVTLPMAHYSGKIIDRLVALGATSINSVTFLVKDMTAQENQVRALAAQDARVRGEAIAKGLGLRLGRVASVNRHSKSDGVYAVSGSAGSPSNSAEPVPRGTDVWASVLVEFELE